jgi:hypothetical protein
MAKAKRTIILTPEDRWELEAFTNSGVRSIKLYKRVESILARDTSEDRSLAKEAAITVKKDFLASGDLKSLLPRKKRETPPVPAKVTGEVEARIIALACGKPSAGFATGSLRVLADTCVELP